MRLPFFIYVILINIRQYLYIVKKYKSGIKIPGFRQKLPQNTKKLKQEKKMFLCIRPSVSKLKNSYCIFHTPKKIF